MSRTLHWLSNKDNSLAFCSDNCYGFPVSLLTKSHSFTKPSNLFIMSAYWHPLLATSTTAPTPWFFLFTMVKHSSHRQIPVSKIIVSWRIYKYSHWRAKVLVAFPTLVGSAMAVMKADPFGHCLQGLVTGRIC